MTQVYSYVYCNTYGGGSMSDRLPVEPPGYPGGREGASGLAQELSGLAGRQHLGRRHYLHVKWFDCNSIKSMKEQKIFNESSTNNKSKNVIKLYFVTILFVRKILFGLIKSTIVIKNCHRTQMRRVQNGPANMGHEN